MTSSNTTAFVTSGRLAEIMSFSSFSHSPHDMWGYDIERPYSIVLLPGYEVPASLDKRDKDAMWFKGEVTKKMIVWDGFSPTALFEIIRECMDYEGTSPFIRVVETETGVEMEDPRDPEVMAMRPVRRAGWGPKTIHNHVADLWYWSSMFRETYGTDSIYGECMNRRTEGDHSAVDHRQRRYHFMERHIFDEDVFKIASDLKKEGIPRKVLSFGLLPERTIDARFVLSATPAPDEKKLRAARKIIDCIETRAAAERDVKRYDMSAGLRFFLGEPFLEMEDFRESGPPASYYMAAMEKGMAARRRRLGLSENGEDSAGLPDEGAEEKIEEDPSSRRPRRRARNPDGESHVVKEDYSAADPSDGMGDMKNPF